MRIPRRPPLLALACAALLACTGERAAARDSTLVVTGVALVDSVPFENELTEGVLRRVAVATGTRTDTIRGILTRQLPARLGDTAIAGFRYEQDRVLGAFHYSPGTRALRSVALPPDFYAYATPRFAPDGRHLAYLGRDAAGAGYAVIVSWPDLRVVHRGAPVALLATDAGFDEIRWTSPTVVEVGIALDAPSRATQRTRATIAADGSARATIDTLPAAPPR